MSTSRIHIRFVAVIALLLSLFISDRALGQTGFMGKKFFSDVYYVSYPLIDLGGEFGLNYGGALGYSLTDGMAVAVFHERVDRPAIDYRSGVSGINYYFHRRGGVAPVGKAFYLSYQLRTGEGLEAPGVDSSPDIITSVHHGLGIGHENRIPVGEGKWYIRTNFHLTALLFDAPGNIGVTGRIDPSAYLISLRLGIGTFFGGRPVVNP